MEGDEVWHLILPKSVDSMSNCGNKTLSSCLTKTAMYEIYKEQLAGKPLLAETKFTHTGHMSLQLLSKVWNYKKVNGEGEGGFGQGQEVVIHKHYKNNIILFLFLNFLQQSCFSKCAVCSH